MHRASRVVMVAIFLASLGACDNTPRVADVFPCETKTSDSNSTVMIMVRDAQSRPVSGVLLALDPFGREAVSNRYGGACFGNLRIRGGADECVLASLTATKRGFGRYRVDNIVLGRQLGLSIDVDLKADPVDIHGRRPNAATCAISA